MLFSLLKMHQNSPIRQCSIPKNFRELMPWTPLQHGRGGGLGPPWLNPGYATAFIGPNLRVTVTWSKLLERLVLIGISYNKSQLTPVLYQSAEHFKHRPSLLLIHGTPTIEQGLLLEVFEGLRRSFLIERVLWCPIINQLLTYIQHSS